MGRLTKIGYIPCGRCRDDLTKEIKYKVGDMVLYATVPCPHCRKRYYSRAVNAIKRKGGKLI